MAIDWWTFALQAVNVLILIAILSRFLFKPVAGVIAERQAAAQQLIDEAGGERTKAAAALAEAQAEARRQADARDARLSEAQAAAEAAGRLALETARVEALRIVTEARTEVERLKSAERKEAERRASQLAVEIAARLLARAPSGALVAGFVDGLCEALGALPENARAEIGAGAPARLLVSHALSEAEQSRVSEQISHALGRPATLAFEVDPSLIAGLEIATAHAKVSNNFREDLRRIQEELEREPR